MQLMARDLSPAAPEKSQVHGQLSLQRDTAGFVLVTGHLSAQAFLPCDRCGEDVHVPVETDVAATFRPAYETNIPREISLSAEDLEVYFIENGEVDLEVLVNDALQCALPGNILCLSSNCHSQTESDDGLVFKDSKDFRTESPFAVLKNLKKS